MIFIARQESFVCEHCGRDVAALELVPGFDQSVLRFITEVNKSVVPHEKYYFETDMHRAVATSLAKSRVYRILGSRTDNSFTLPLF